MRVLFLLISFVFATNAMASDMYDQMFSEAKQQENVKNEQQKAIDDAKNLSKQNINKLKLKSEFLAKQKKPVDKKDNIIIKTSPAPFGLIWGASIAQTKANGLKLKEYNLIDYPNSFEATLLPKPLEDINKVIITFGSSDTLWKILAYGNFIKDDASASVALKEYKKYYNLLETKYGNANQTFMPAKKTITEIVDNKEVKKIIDEPIGNKNFLAQLESGEAVLYSNFNNDDVGVALSLNADGNGNTFIAIDYNNIHFLDKKEEETIDAL